MKQPHLYCLNVWLTSVIAGPLLLLAISLLIKRSLGFEFLPIAWLFGAFCSLPSLLLFMIGAKYLIKQQLNTIIAKLILSAAGALLTYIPFFMINGYKLLLDGDKLSRFLFFSYSFVIIFGVWFYKLEPIIPKDSISLNSTMDQSS